MLVRPSHQLNSPPRVDAAAHCRGDGVVQLLLDAAFARAAARAPAHRFVLARADGIELHRFAASAPGAIASQIVFEGRSSLTVRVEIEDDAMPKCFAQGRFMLIAIDDGGLPAPLPVSDQRSSEDSSS